MVVRHVTAPGSLCAALVVIAVGTTSVPTDPRPVVQPIAFNHKRHAEEELSCTSCHQHAEQGAHAGFPATRSCLLCHEEAVGEHRDEPKVREYAERGVEIPWVQVNTLAGHVYFSHAAHVKFAEMDCSQCHGRMEETAEPVTLPQITHLDMDRCMACHESAGASNDCLVCHK